MQLINSLEMGDYPGLSDGLNEITKVLIRGRQEGQSQRRNDRSRGQSDRL